MSLHYGRILALAAVAAVAVGMSLSAQDQPGQPPRQAPPGQPPRVAQPGVPASNEAHPGRNIESLFAACLVYCNENEITLAKLAQQRSGDDDVKKFAEAIEKDHQQLKQELQRFAGNTLQPRTAQNRQPADRETLPPAAAGREPAPPTAPGQRPAPPTAPIPAQRPAGAVAAVGGDIVPTLVEIRREVADECLASAQSELSSKKGTEFDACFVGLQIGAHMMLVDELKVLERHVSPEMQSVLRKGRETAQAHLDRAKELMKGIDTSESRKAASLN